jgi:type IV pilus assembly protein PilQ
MAGQYINTTSASTEVVTQDGETVVMGGLIQNSQPVNGTKVPVLGNIPLLGRLFKSSPRVPAKQELVIFIGSSSDFQPQNLQSALISQGFQALPTLFKM